MKSLEIATLLGARILEKHFTHDKTLPGNDHYHAMDKEDLKCFHTHLDTLFKTLGKYQKQPLASEESARKNARRSLVAARAIPAGKKIEPLDITWKRPGKGINPRDYDRIIGRTAEDSIEEDTVLTWSMFSD
jgi:N-acetylneuraminate synthase